jgi:hypothetical protein
LSKLFALFFVLLYYVNVSVFAADYRQQLCNYYHGPAVSFCLLPTQVGQAGEAKQRGRAYFHAGFVSGFVPWTFGPSEEEEREFVLLTR